MGRGTKSSAPQLCSAPASAPRRKRVPSPNTEPACAWCLGRIVRRSLGRLPPSSQQPASPCAWTVGRVIIFTRRTPLLPELPSSDPLALGLSVSFSESCLSCRPPPLGMPPGPRRSERTRRPKALFSSQKLLQNFSDSPSHQIFRRMHRVLNIDKNKN